MSEDPIMDEAARLIYQAGEDRLGPSSSREESLQRARAAQDPRIAAVRHGLYARTSGCLACDRCAIRTECELYAPGERCALEQVYLADRQRQIATVLADDGQDPALYTALIASAIWAEIRLDRAMRYVGRHGEFRDGDYTGVANAFPALQRALNSALDALNLTPAARTRLEAQRAAAAGHRPHPFAAVMVDAEAAGVDGDLTPRPDGPPPAAADDAAATPSVPEGVDGNGNHNGDGGGGGSDD